MKNHCKYTTNMFYSIAMEQVFVVFNAILTIKALCVNVCLRKSPPFHSFLVAMRQEMEEMGEMDFF